MDSQHDSSSVNIDMDFMHVIKNDSIRYIYYQKTEALFSYLNNL